MTSRTQRVGTMVLAAVLSLCLVAAVLTASAAAGASGPATAASADKTGKQTLAFLVRHTEKTTEEPGDPPISEIGIKRAEDLARLLSAAGVTNLYATQYQRTHQTLAPLATAFDLEVEEFEALKPEQQAAAIRALPAGSVAVVAGHSNTIPQIAGLLGGEISDLVDGPAGPMIRDETYDRLFLLILPVDGGDAKTARSQTVELRYGD